MVVPFILALIAIVTVAFERREQRPLQLFGWLVLLAIAVVTTVASALLTPKPKEPKPASVDDLQDPTNDAGREMMVVFGEGTITSPNILWFGDKGVKNYTVNA